MELEGIKLSKISQTKKKIPDNLLTSDIYSNKNPNKCGNRKNKTTANAYSQIIKASNGK